MSDLSPEAEELLKNARAAFSPGDVTIDAMRAALAARLSLPPEPPAAGAGAPGAVAAAGATAKLAGIGVVLVALAVGAGALVVRERRDALPRPAASSTSTILAPPLPIRADDEGALPQQVPSIAVDDLPAARAEPAGPLRVPPRAPLRLHSSAPPAAVDEPPSLEPTALATGAVAQAVPQPMAGAVLPPQRVDALEESGPVAPTVPTASPQSIDATLAGELSFLREAHIALDRGDATHALVLLDRYVVAYPHGTLEEESLAARTMTLCALGRVEAAKQAARSLATLAPRSPQLRRVRASCAGDGDGPR